MDSTLLATLKHTIRNITKNLIYGIDTNGKPTPIGIAIGTEGDPQQVVQQSPRYLPLGELIGGLANGNAAGATSGYQVAAAAFVYTNYIDNVSWVRSVLFLARSQGQSYDLVYKRMDKDGSESMENIITGNQPSTVNWRNHIVFGAVGIIGNKVKFGLQNKGAAAVDMWLRVELFG